MSDAQQTERLSVAEIATLTDTSAKTIRAYLRRNHARSAEVKGSRWGDAKHAFILSKALTAELVTRFTADDSETDDS